MDDCSESPVVLGGVGTFGSVSSGVSVAAEERSQKRGQRCACGGQGWTKCAEWRGIGRRLVILLED